MKFRATEFPTNNEFSLRNFVACPRIYLVPEFTSL